MGQVQERYVCPLGEAATMSNLRTESRPMEQTRQHRHKKAQPASSAGSGMKVVLTAQKTSRNSNPAQTGKRQNLRVNG